MKTQKPDPQHQLDLEETYANRARRYDLTLDQAKSERAGTALGRAFLRGAITEQQYVAGSKLNAAFLAAKATYGVPPGSSKHEPDETEEEKEAIGVKTKAIRGKAWRMGMAACNTGWEGGRAVKTIVLDDKDNEAYYPALKKALQAVHELC